MQHLTKKYGLITAICMVVGIVIGSGIFFKATTVFDKTNGNAVMSLAVVLAVGAVMVICSYVFATLANKFEKVNGVVDYAEATLGRRFAYYVGWFMTTMYYPILTSTLAWVSAMYTCGLVGFAVGSGEHLVLAALYLLLGYGVNALSPRLAGYFQVSTTIIKLIPIGLLAIVGTIVGLVRGTTVASFAERIPSGSGGGFFAAVAAFAFAYEGWIIATAINSELKNSKRNLPVALILGSAIVISVYLLYFLGTVSILSPSEIVGAGGNLPSVVFTALFGSPVFGTIVMVFLVISCLGTMNGLMLGCCRGMYSLAARGEGPCPKIFSRIDEKTEMPHNSSIIGLILCGVWLFQWQIFYCKPEGSPIPDFLAWEGDEVSIITLYAFYIPMFLAVMLKCRDLSPVKRFVMPALALLCCVFMCYSAYDAYRADGKIFGYLATFAVIMAIGAVFDLLKTRREKKAGLTDDEYEEEFEEIT